MFQEHNLPTIRDNQHYAAIKLLTFSKTALRPTKIEDAVQFFCVFYSMQ